MNLTWSWTPISRTEFSGAIERASAAVDRALLHKAQAQKKGIHTFLAKSTKGNTILQWCGIDHRIIDVAAERNPDKYGAKTLGTDIPIVSEEQSRAMNPDYYLVLPWHFKDGVLEREKASPSPSRVHLPASRRLKSWADPDERSFPSGKVGNAMPREVAMIFGANGQDGHYLQEHLGRGDWRLLGISRSGPFIHADLGAFQCRSKH